MKIFIFFHLGNQIKTQFNQADEVTLNQLLNSKMFSLTSKRMVSIEKYKGGEKKKDNKNEVNITNKILNFT